jgi:succinate dehydrogenase/fumarate reductase flavoprotein subunit
MAGADLTADGQGMRTLGFFGEPRDTKQKFFSDIVHQGCFLNDQRLTQIYADDAPDRLGELMDWGIKANFTDERAIFTAGTGIMDALHRQSRKVGVERVEDVAMIDLLVQDGRVVGALGLDVYTGEFITFLSKAVVLATGGWHKAYTPVSGSRELTGDGIAMAYRVGAELANMEFVTYCCNVSLWPPIWAGSIFPYVLSLVVGGSLVNSLGEPFLEKYDPHVVDVALHTEWNKSFISFATEVEVRAGKGSPRGGVYYVTGDMPWETFDAHVQRQYPGWQYKAVDFSEMRRIMQGGGGAEVGAVAEYFPGGIAVDEHYATNVPGLYAAGECAVSLFGANRVMAATTEMLVTGAVAGWAAGEHAASTREPVANSDQVRALVEKTSLPLARGKGVRPVQVRKRLQVAASDKVGPIRTGDELNEFLAFTGRLKDEELPALYTSSQSKRYNKEWFEALELENMIQVLELSAVASLTRTESRGVHYREDHPDTDNDRWIKEIVIKRANGEPQVTTRPLATTTLSPPRGVLPYEAMIKRMIDARSDIKGHH